MSIPIKNIMKPIPIILCGKSTPVATGVMETIKPTYEAIHIIQSVEAGVQDLPPLLQGHCPLSKELANLGTQNYGRKVAAVVVGGGYNDTDFEEFRKSCLGKNSIPWLRHDISMDIDPRQPKPKIGVEYGKQIGKMVVQSLQDLKEQGKMDQDGVYWF